MTNDVIKDYYRAERYDWIEDTRYPAKLFHLLRARHVAALANALIDDDDVVIDLGCGTGLITQYLCGLVTGVDINPWAVARARVHCPDKAFVVYDSEYIPFDDNSINVVVCSDVLEHLTDAAITVRQIHRILRPGGWLIGEVPSQSALWHYRKLLGSTYRGSEPFHNNYGIAQLHVLLRQFTDVTIRRAVFGTELSFTVRKGAV